ncbi:MAG TPA: acyl-ACP thioesterase domain-containing protein [Thermoanaerobaculia bacterium]|nr:acyl-ACP thioesterase domain-containing protein [Thermoanaerobaculia bacterium]
MSAVHRETFRVRASEVGPGGVMRLPALLDLFQEAAGNSATSLGWGSDTLLAQGKTWILSRHHLRLHALPAWREDVAIETWPSGVHRVFALREFRATGAGGRLLAEATSAWLLVAVPSKRPLRQPPEIEAIGAGAPRVIPDTFEPLAAPPGGAAPGPGTRVGRFDLDLNAHANNVAIFRALLESLPHADPPFDFEAEFRGEAFEGDFLEGRTDEGGGARRVALVRAADGKEIARAVFARRA